MSPEQRHAALVDVIRAEHLRALDDFDFEPAERIALAVENFLEGVAA